MNSLDSEFVISLPVHPAASQEHPKTTPNTHNVTAEKLLALYIMTGRRRQRGSYGQVLRFGDV